MIYLASPYSSPDESLREARYHEVMRFVEWCLTRGNVGVPFSPILYCHPLAERYELPTSAEWWYALNDEWLTFATQVWLLDLPGWETSVGVRHELTFASERGIPMHIFHLKDSGYDYAELEYQPINVEVFKP